MEILSKNPLGCHARGSGAVPSGFSKGKDQGKAEETRGLSLECASRLPSNNSSKDDEEKFKY